MIKNKKWKDALIIIGGTLAFAVIAMLGSMNSKEVYGSLEMPPLSPPSYVFGIVWPILYAMMAIATILIKWKAPSGQEKKDAISTYWMQLLLNALWPYLFFVFGYRFFAFMWLAVLLYFVVLLFIRYYKLYKPAGFLLLPYLLWTAFATYLNYFTWLLNR